ncbi:MAG: ABC transporter permease [Patescibacteria group bacterium]
MKQTWYSIIHIFLFFIALIFVMIRRLFIFLRLNKTSTYHILNHLEKTIFLRLQSQKRINTTNLILLALKRIKSRRTSTNIAILGMGIGVSLIIFMIGMIEGVERTIIQTAFDLDEQRQIIVTKDDTAQQSITSKTYYDIVDLPNVEGVLPITSLIGALESDLGPIYAAGYAVDRVFLSFSSDRMIAGVPLSFVNSSNPDAIDIVVNRTMADHLRLDSESFEPQQISSTIFPAVSGSSQPRNRSVPTKLRVVGIINETTPEPYFYLSNQAIADYPFLNYLNQLNVLVADQDQLETVRQQIKSLGFHTLSVADTIEEIDRIFAVVQLVVSALGGIALIVAILSIFNSLTMSLIDRTEEIGFMKIIGMNSIEIKDLFLTESLLLSVIGTLLGLGLGILGGCLVSGVYMLLAVSYQYPPYFFFYLSPVIIVIALASATAIGFITGWLPAKRAAKISALNSIRYE